MKKIFFISFFSLATVLVFAQSKKEKAVIERTYLLSNTVFGTKDRSVVEDLFAKEATYGHSGGKVENRGEAIAGITGNQSVYTDTSITLLSVVIEDDVAIVRQQFKAKEKKVDGTVGQLNLGLMLVWVKEKRKWRLMGRQAVRLS